MKTVETVEIIKLDDARNKRAQKRREIITQIAFLMAELLELSSLP